MLCTRGEKRQKTTIVEKSEVVELYNQFGCAGIKPPSLENDKIFFKDGFLAATYSISFAKSLQIISGWSNSPQVLPWKVDDVLI